MTVFAAVPVDEFRKSAENYQQGSGASFLIFAGISVAALLAAVLTWRIIHYRNARRRPLLLFYDLADFHGISRNMQKKLVHFAHAHDVADPACLFVCRELVKRIQSAEMAEAAGGKESRRLKEFFSDFSVAAFGKGAGGADGADGGAS